MKKERVSKILQEFSKENYPFPSEAIVNIAKSVVDISVNVKPGEKVLVFFDPLGRPLVNEITRLCGEREAQVKFFQRNLEEEVKLVSNASFAEIDDYFSKQKVLIEETDAMILIRAQENPEVLKEIPDERVDYYNEKFLETHICFLKPVINHGEKLR